MSQSAWPPSRGSGGRIGIIGFGGPPAHIALLRKLCVGQRGWLTAREFEDGVATTQLFPGPASTQLAIFCAWRLRGRPGAIIGGVCFIVPGLIIILTLSALFFASHPPLWVQGAAARAGAGGLAAVAWAAFGLLSVVVLPGVTMFARWIPVYRAPDSPLILAAGQHGIATGTEAEGSFPVVLLTVLGIDGS